MRHTTLRLSDRDAGLTLSSNGSQRSFSNSPMLVKGRCGSGHVDHGYLHVNESFFIWQAIIARLDYTLLQ